MNNKNSQFYLTRYLQNIVDKEKLDHLKFDIDRNIYSYGEHFQTSSEKKQFSDFQNIKLLLWSINKLFNNKKINGYNNVISNSYFKLENELKLMNYDVYTPPWYFKNLLIKYKERILIHKMLQNLNTNNFLDLISQENFNLIDKIQDLLYNFYTSYNIKAVFLPNDKFFFESLSIKIMKNLNKKSFIFLHGLPGIYNSIDNLKSDYLFVWGEKIKENYVKVGVKSEKIFVVGHPNYKKLENKIQRNSLENILILGKSCFAGQHGDYETILSDRGNSILYLYSIQNVLKKLGIQKVRFRPHPSENLNWYYKFIDKSFFIPDTGNFIECLNRSTLIIGPTSTVFIEALYHGINYIVYELSNENQDVLNCNLVPPFDGSDPRLKVAKNEEELYELVKKKQLVDIDILQDYIKTPFDISIVKELI